MTHKIARFNRSALTPFGVLAAAVAALFAPSWSLAQGACPADMKEVHIGKSVSCIPEEASLTQAKDKLSRDPRFAEMLKGTWDYFHPERAPAGEFCSALFQNQDAMIWLMGPGGSYRGALLRFYGERIPKPANPDKTGMGRQKITLTQDAEPPQTLTVLSHDYKEFEFGVLSMPVPSLEALIGSIADKQAFKIAIDDVVVFDSAWRNGLQARDALQKCAQAKP